MSENLDLERIHKAAKKVADDTLSLLPVTKTSTTGYKGGWGWIDHEKDDDLLELCLALQGDPPDDGTWNGAKSEAAIT